MRLTVPHAGHSGKDQSHQRKQHPCKGYLAATSDLDAHLVHLP
jgi:hypothetical protein